MGFLGKQDPPSWLFFNTMEHDYCRFVQKYHKCQVHGDLIRVPPQELNAMGSPWPFVAWGMDVIGQLSKPPLMDIDLFWFPLISSPSWWKQILINL